ncbi:MAG: extracellular solute-binding protein [Leptotrichiaceae bacterium]|nr:extracellular solute-binding protein [Leptotrichiaceae bacterium]
MKLKKVLFLVLICLSALLSCKNEKSSSSEGGGKLSGNLITSKPREVTVFAIFQGKAIDGELPVFKKAFEETNIKLVSVASKNQSDEVQGFNLMLSSGKLPDIIAYELVSDFENLGMEGGLIPLEDLIDKHAPNIKKFWEENPRYKQDAVAADGHIYMIPNYNDYFNLKTTQGYFIRKDWLKKLNLQEPKTADELYNVLTAFRDKDPNGNGKKDEIPVFLRGNVIRKIMMGLADIFKAKVVWYDDKGNPQFGPAGQEYKEAMIQLAKWYKEGLIDKEIFTRGMNSRDYMLSNDLGGFTNDWFASTASYNEKLASKISGFDFSPILPPEYKGNNKTIFTRPTYIGGWGITSAAKNPVELIKYFDFWYSPEGRRLWNFGIEGEDYKMVDGKPVFTDKILKDPQGKNPLAVIRTTGAQYRLGMFQDAEAEKQLSGQNNGVDMYISSDVIQDDLPILKYTKEEAKEFLKIDTQLRAYTEEMTQKWIMGVSDVEKDWDNYIKRLNEIGLKRAEEIQKTAYIRFMKK